jgi:Glycine-zipper domain
MRYKKSSLLLGAVSACASLAVWGQQAAAPPPAQAAPPQSLSASLGVAVFPAKNQTATQQSQDEGYCYSWAKTNSGIDPMAPPPQVTAQQADPAAAGQGAGARGAVKGAAAGAAIGAIAGDAGKGAAIGATTGVIAGGSQRRHAQQQTAQQNQQAQANAAQQSQAIAAQNKATYNKSFTACMEGKGYTAK